jgi:hypothetical protein
MDQSKFFNNEVNTSKHIPCSATGKAGFGLIFLQGIGLGVAACLLSVLIYGDNILLSGDQSPQLAAAISVVEGEGLRVPPSYLEPGAVFDPALATREKFAWFAPGYSMMLAFFLWLGASVHLAAGAVFYLNKFLTGLLWTFVAKKYAIPFWQVAAVVCLQSLLYMPASTTDQLVWPAMAGLFLLAKRNVGWLETLAAAALIIYVTWTRWHGVMFTGVWFLWVWMHSLRDWRNPGLWVRSMLPLFTTAVFFLGTVFYLTGSFDPFTSEPKEEIRWILLLKGLYFCVTGGISSVWTPVQGGLALVAVAVMCGLCWLAARDFRKIPLWLAMVIVFQAVNMAFLIYYEVNKGSVFEPEVPAFATARYFGLIQPLALACIYWVIGALRPTVLIRRGWETVTVAAFLAAGISFVFYNWDSIRNKLAPAANGLLIPKEYVELQKRLLEIQPDVWIVSSGQNSKSQLYDPATTTKYEESLYDARKTFTKSVETCIQEGKLVVVESVGGKIVDIRDTLARTAE